MVVGFLSRLFFPLCLSVCGATQKILNSALPVLILLTTLDKTPKIGYKDTAQQVERMDTKPS
jgi:hypothetical protein